MTALIAVTAGGVLALAGATSAMAGGLHASDDDDNVSNFTFSQFDARYLVDQDADGYSTLDATETFVAEFPDFDQNKGIIRAIPETYEGVPLDTTVESVVDASGQDVPYELDSEDGFVTLALGTDDYVRGQQTYVIHYTQKNVVGTFENTDADEFYWDMPGTGFAQPFAEASATVEIAPGLVDSLTGNSACYVGNQGSTDDCALTEQATGSGTTFTIAPQQLQPSSTFTVAIGFDKGTFTQPVRPATLPVFTVVPGTVTGIGVVVAGIAGLLRRRSTRDNAGRGTIIPQYSEPEDLDLYTASNLIGKESKATSAQIIRLAVRRNVRIIQDRDAQNEHGTGDGFLVEYIGADGATETDLTTLRILFGDLVPGAVCDLGVKSESLTTALNALQSKAASKAKAAGYRRRAHVAGAALLRIGAGIIAVAGAVIMIAGLASYGSNAWTVIGGFGGVILFILTIVLTSPREALTAEGAERRDYLLGMKEYLTLAEADRFRVLQSPQGAERVDVGDNRQVLKVYEKLLPYAVLWDVEENWADALSAYYAQAGYAPDWYASNAGFNAALFHANIASMSATTVAGSSAWSSSGGSSSFGGSMGGGFAGGGGGGGGGGGR
ncbi:hypothetical protein ALI44B_01815 [Leifsonia sp. ALI-44-B]|nr:hypothetical protein ALI44B_01815 [Leifsonia sp. ALI-44-B]